MFKNATIYKITGPAVFDVPAIEVALQSAEFFPTSGTQQKSIGFVPPREVNGALVEVVDSQLIIKVMIETRSVPASAINAEFALQQAQHEDETGRKMGKKEARGVKDDIMLALLPNAFPKQGAVFVWIDRDNRRVLLDSTSTGRLDDVVTLLVRSIEGFTIAEVAMQTSSAALMALALTEGEFTQNFSIDRECELKASDESAAVVRYAKHSLDTDEVKQHIRQGKMPTKLALTWNDRLSFVLTENFQIRKIGFLDVVFEGGDPDADDTFDGDVMIATGELSGMLDDLIDAHGGIVDATDDADPVFANEDDEL